MNMGRETGGEMEVTEKNQEKSDQNDFERQERDRNRG